MFTGMRFTNARGFLPGLPMRGTLKAKTRRRQPRVRRGPGLRGAGSRRREAAAEARVGLFLARPVWAERALLLR
jgi:hypothetical protein